MMSKQPRRGPQPSAEPFLWLGFSAGGMLTALAVPALLFLFGVAFPLGWLDPPAFAHLHAVVAHPITRIGLLVLALFSLIHFAHRFRFTLIDGLQLHRYDQLIAAVCYGLAGAGTLLAGYLLFFAL